MIDIILDVIWKLKEFLRLVQMQPLAFEKRKNHSYFIEVLNTKLAKNLHKTIKVMVKN